MIEVAGNYCLSGPANLIWISHGSHMALSLEPEHVSDSPRSGKDIAG